LWVGGGKKKEGSGRDNGAKSTWRVLSRREVILTKRSLSSVAKLRVGQARTLFRRKKKAYGQEKRKVLEKKRHGHAKKISQAGKETSFTPLLQSQAGSSTKEVEQTAERRCRGD